MSEKWFFSYFGFFSAIFKYAELWLCGNQPAIEFDAKDCLIVVYGERPKFDGKIIRKK